MRETDRLFAGSIPEIYDRYSVPLIFDPYARDLAGGSRPLALPRARDRRRHRHRHPRAGRRAARRCDRRHRPQPADARLRGRGGPSATVAWRQADAWQLPFADASFDAVVCQFGVMFFPDRVAGYARRGACCGRAGRSCSTSGTGSTHNELPHGSPRPLAAVFPDDPPRFLARLPHGYHEVDGFAPTSPAARLHRHRRSRRCASCRAPSPRHPAIGFCQGTPLRSEIEARDPGRLDEITDAAAHAIATRFGDGMIEGRMQAHVIVARH